MQNTLSNYISYFSSLHTNKNLGMPAPHKAILLLSVIDLIETKIIDTNHIILSERLEHSFKRNWNKYVGNSIIFSPKIGTPYFHLHSEPFWKLIPYTESENAIEDMKRSNPYSLKALKTSIKYAEIDRELFDLLQDEDIRAKLRTTLISLYIHPQKRIIDTILPIVISTLLIA